MINHLTDEALETLLTNYGQLQPPVSFTYQKKPPVFGKRLAALSVAALLALLLLGMTAGIVAHFTGEGYASPPSPSGTPVIENPLQTSGSIPADSNTTTVTHPIPKPPVTTPDIPKPPLTFPPITTPSLPSLLPAWYTGSSIRLVNFIPSTQTPTFRPAELQEIYNDYAFFDLDIGYFSHTIVSGDLVLLQEIPAGHNESYCNVIYLRPSDGELICLGHELKELWASAGVDFDTLTYISYRYASEDGNCYVVAATTNAGEIGEFVYDRTRGTLQKIPFDCANSDFVSYSPDCNYIVVAMVQKDTELLDDLFLIDLTTLEVKQICEGYDTFGQSIFSSDKRYVYTHLRIGDAVDSNEYGEWVLYDIETGFTFQGQGQILYLQDNILISRTLNGFSAYDCTTGETPDDLSALPLIIDADYKNHRYTITVYNPATGEVEATISDVGAYEISSDQRYLFYYVHKAEGVVMADLYSAESVILPVSAALLEGANPSEGLTIYSLAINGDGSEIALGYTISMQGIYEQRRQDIWALEELIEEAVLKTNNLPAFWEYFNQRSAPYNYLINYIDYDIHDGYVILQINNISDAMNTHNTWTRHLVEDYRDDTFTLYNALTDPYTALNIHARSAYETKVQTFRRKLKDGDYEASCALLKTVGDARPFYVDYADCYDSKGKWSEQLAASANCAYDLLRPHVTSANFQFTPEGLDQILQIISRYPLYKEGEPEKTVRRVADIQLYDASRVELYSAQIVVGTSGTYYLRSRFTSGCYQKITYEDYLLLMEAQGGFLVETGLYKDPRLANVPVSVHIDAAYDFLPCGGLPYFDHFEITDQHRKAAADALAMIREGGYSTDEIIKTFYHEKSAYDYIYLLAEYKVNGSWKYTVRDAEPILIEIRDGVISLSDPSAP